MAAPDDDDAAVHFESFRALALRLALDGGQRIRNVFHKDPSADGNSIQFKGLIDLVTQTDKEVEEHIISEIKKEYPTHKFLAEESYDGHNYNFTDDPTWIIDPIDGTTNFVHRYPLCCVSIGFAINKRVVVGVVYNPILDEMYEAVTGKGAFMNGKRIRVSGAQKIHECIAATNVGYDRTPEGIDFMLSNVRVLLENNVQSLRSQGTSAIDLCAVAVGRIDTFYEYGIHPWDIAAAMLIVLEAGGVVLDPITGEPVHLEARRVLVGNSTIAQQMLGLLRKTKVPSKHRRLLDN